MSSPSTYKLKLIDKEQKAKDIYSFYFEKPADFDYISGQYIKMVLDIKNPGINGNARFFTIASSPHEENLMITTKLKKNSNFKRDLVSKKIGEMVSIRGPHGSFVINPSEKRPVALLSGGVGITPFRSMFVSSYHNKLSNIMVLLASFTNITEALYVNELSRLSNERRIFAPSVTSQSDSWEGDVGRINLEKLKTYIANPKECVYYIAGPQTFVDEMIDNLKSLGVSDKSINREDFPGYFYDKDKK